MAPYDSLPQSPSSNAPPLTDNGTPPVKHGRADTKIEGVILEAWSQGFMVGGLIVLIMITIANMRRHVLLHKLILLELIMALGHGTFIFLPDPAYGWYLSCTAIFLYLSWYLHNIIAWIKNKPFLPRWGSRVYICSVVFVFPYWISEMYLNFNYFNNLGSEGFQRTRPWEALARDPWWIFTTCNLIWVIKREYNFGLFELIRASPRFGVLIISMFLSIVFLLADVVVTAAHVSQDDGINPYWKLALVFKCAADALFLDDFKKVLDVLINHTLGKVGGQVHHASDQPAAVQVQDQRRAHDFGLQPIYSVGSNGSQASSARKHSLFKPNSQSDQESHGRKHSVFTMPKFGSSPRPPSHESFRSEDKFIQRPYPARGTSHGRRPTAEWFDVMPDNHVEHIPNSGVAMVNTAEVSPSTSTSTKERHLVNPRSSDQSVEFVTRPF